MNENNNICITNIQRFSLYDGPGIRTTVFLKGCSLCCPWCCNPENLSAVYKNCSQDAGNIIYVESKTSTEIYNEIVKDKIYYGRYDPNKTNDHINSVSELNTLPGGVTFSGGEPLLQMENLKPLLELLKTEKIHIAVETCLFVPRKMVQIALHYINLFYVDAKILDQNNCKNILNGDLRLYYDNLETLFASGKPIVIRIPVIGGYTDTKSNQDQILKLLDKYKPVKVEIIKEHNLGSSKYTLLSLPAPDYKGVSEELMDTYKKEIEKLGLVAQICKI